MNALPLRRLCLRLHRPPAESTAPASCGPVLADGRTPAAPGRAVLPLDAPVEVEVQVELVEA
ncbi:hypothetical protein SBADM41S_00913 [Streptomyces badius]